MILTRRRRGSVAVTAVLLAGSMFGTGTAGAPGYGDGGP